jgi:TonB family protein
MFLCFPRLSVRPGHANHGPGETLSRPQRIALAFFNLLYLARTKALVRLKHKNRTILFDPPALALHLPSLVWGNFPPREVVVHIQFNWTRKILAAVAGTLLVLSLAAAQTMNDEGKRRLKTKAAVIYPELARRMNVSGKVKIEVVIAPDGRVRSAKAVGGHPLLVQSCLETVKDWKYEPAGEETTQIVEFEFKGQQ